MTRRPQLGVLDAQFAGRAAPFGHRCAVRIAEHHPDVGITAVDFDSVLHDARRAVEIGDHGDVVDVS